MRRLDGPDGTAEREVHAVTLDGAPYLLTYTWNDVASGWYLNVAGDGGVLLLAGVRIICRVALLNLHTNTIAALPQGVLMVLTRSADLSDPGQNDFVEGGRCQLFYITREEALRIRASGEAAQAAASGITVRKVEGGT